MQTGDGLLVRMLPTGTIPLVAFAGLCAAARAHGNGIIEVTARGSIQVRGLDAASAPRFAAGLGELGIAAADGVAVHASPLSGLDPGEILDAGMLAGDLRRALARTDIAARLAAKISVAVDGGGLLSLDTLAADLRLRAELIDGEAALRISVGGDRASATHLGAVAPANAVEAVIRLLAVIARRGRNARARAIRADEGIAPFQQALSSCLASCRASTSCDEAKDVDSRDKPGHEAAGTRGEAIGPHCLRDGSFAYGLGVTFGHADGTLLESLTGAAVARGAIGTRTAPGRVLIFIGLPRQALTAFAADAEGLGFVVRADDPRRHVIACAGAPVCASGHIPARAMAPRLAADLAHVLGETFTLHASGCAKGCAHPAPAALTIVGTAQGCALIANGAARQAPFTVVKSDEVAAAVATYARALPAGGRHV